MPYLGAEPAPSALQVTASDIADDAVTTAKIADNAVSLDKMVGGTDGNVISYDSSGNPVAIATGTSGHFLKSAGANAQPVFAAAGGLVFIETTDISGTPAAINFTAVNANLYDAYMCVLMNVTPTSDNKHFYMRTSTAGDSNYDDTSGDYNWAVTSQGGANSSHTYGSGDVMALTGNTATVDYTVGSGSNETGISGVVWVLGPHLAKQTMITWNLFFDSANPGGHAAIGGALRDSPVDTDAWQWFFEAGNLESGTITVYGVVNG